MLCQLLIVVDSLKKLIANATLKLRRDHIEHIDFDPMVVELNVPQPSMQTLERTFKVGCTLEAFLGCQQLQLAIRIAVGQRINTLRKVLRVPNEQSVGLPTLLPESGNKGIQAKNPQESLKAELKKQNLHLATIEEKLNELNAKTIEIKKRRHSSEAQLPAEFSKQTMASLWEQLTELEHMEDARNSAPSTSECSSVKEELAPRPKNSLLALFSRYFQCRKNTQKVIEALRSVLEMLKKLRPEDGELFKRSFISDSSSQQHQSALTTLLNKRSMASQQSLRKLSNEWESVVIDSPPSYPERRKRKEKPAAKEVGCGGHDCTIF